MTLDPGTKLGHYEIISQIGAGGMGDVYLAEDTRLHDQGRRPDQRIQEMNAAAE